MQEDQHDAPLKSIILSLENATTKIETMRTYIAESDAAIGGAAAAGSPRKLTSGWRLATKTVSLVACSSHPSKR